MNQLQQLDQYQNQFNTLLSAQRDYLQEKWLLEKQGKKDTPEYIETDSKLQAVNELIWQGI